MATNTEKVVVQVIVKGGRKLDELTKKTEKATKKTGGLQKELTKMAAKTFAAATAFRLVSKAVSDSIKTFTAFEFQMAKVRAVSGASNTEFIKLTNTAQELGRTTFFTATQVGELQTNFAKLGFTTTEILAAQEATLQLATATGSDLARSAIVAGSAVRGFGLNASETQRVVDVMSVAFTSSALDIEKFQTSMTKVAPIASAAGISIESTSAIMGTLTDAGIEASIAGTSLRNIFLKMQDPASDLSKHLGFTVRSSDDLEKALKQLNSEGLSNADMMQLVDLRQVAAFQTMVRGTDNILSLTTALENSEGAGKEMADMVGDTLEGAFKRLTSATEGLQIAIVEGFIGQALTKILNVGANVLNFFTDFTKGIVSVNDEIANSAGIYKAQVVQLNVMADRFDVLSSSTNRTKEEDEELQRILVDLQGEFGRSVVSVDKKTDALILNRSALEKVIERTALLADTEALKLVHKLQNVQKEIKLEKDKQDAIDDSTEAFMNNTAAMANSMANQTAANDATTTFIQARDALNNVTDNQNINENELNDTYAESKAIGEVINQLKKDETLLREQLTDAGWDQEQILKLLNDATKTNTVITGGNTDTIKANIKAREELDSSFVSTVVDDYYNSLMKGVLDGTDTMINAEQKLADFQKELINSLLLDESLSYDEKVRLTKQLTQIQLQENQKIVDNQKITSEQRLALMQSASDALFTIVGQNTQRQVGKDSKALEERKDADLITQEQYEEGVEAIQRKAFEKKKRLDIAQAIINGALAMTTVAGQTGVLSFAFSPFIAAMTALQIAIIASQKFANGGMIEEFANGGLVQGKSHAQGGEKFAVGGRVVELEGGEAVINKRSTSMFSSQLSAMNAAGGGVKFADGGILNSPSFSQQEFNAIGQNRMMGSMGGVNKVVVVEADITRSQETVNVIQSQATI